MIHSHAQENTQSRKHNLYRELKSARQSVYKADPSTGKYRCATLPVARYEPERLEKSPDCVTLKPERTQTLKEMEVKSDIIIHDRSPKLVTEINTTYKHCILVVNRIMT